MDLNKIYSMMDKLDSSFLLTEEAMILMEATRDEIYSVYYDEQNGRAKKIARQFFDAVCNMDPTARENQVGPFAKWILNMWYTPKMNESVLEEYLGRPDNFKRDAQTFVKLKNIKCPYVQYDLNKYTLDGFKEKMAEARDNEWDKTKKEQMASGAEILHNDSEWMVLIPHTYEAEVRYGSCTSWCTVPNAGTFENYTREGDKLIIIINKKEPVTTDGGPLRAGGIGNNGNRNGKKKYQMKIYNNGFINTEDRWLCCDANDEHFDYKTTLPENIVSVIDGYALSLKKKYEDSIRETLDIVKQKIDDATIDDFGRGGSINVRNINDNVIVVEIANRQSCFIYSKVTKKFVNSDSENEGRFKFAVMLNGNNEVPVIFAGKEGSRTNVYDRKHKLNDGIILVGNKLEPYADEVIDYDNNSMYVFESTIKTVNGNAIGIQTSLYDVDKMHYDIVKKEVVEVMGERRFDSIMSLGNDFFYLVKRMQYDRSKYVKIFDKGNNTVISDWSKSHTSYLNMNSYDDWYVIEFASNRKIVINKHNRKPIVLSKSGKLADFSIGRGKYSLCAISSSNHFIVRNSDGEVMKNEKGKKLSLEYTYIIGDDTLYINCSKTGKQGVYDLSNDKLDPYLVNGLKILRFYSSENGIYFAELSDGKSYKKYKILCTIKDGKIIPLKIGNTTEYYAEKMIRNYYGIERYYIITLKSKMKCVAYVTDDGNGLVIKKDGNVKKFKSITYWNSYDRFILERADGTTSIMDVFSGEDVKDRVKFAKGQGVYTVEELTRGGWFDTLKTKDGKEIGRRDFFRNLKYK